MGVFKKIKSKILVGILSGVATVCTLSSEAGAMDRPETDAIGFDVRQAVSLMGSISGVLSQDRRDNLMSVTPDVCRAVREAANVTEEILDGFHGVRTVDLTTNEGGRVSMSFDFDNLRMSNVSHLPVSALTQDLAAVFFDHPFFTANPQYAEYLAFVRRIPTDVPTVKTSVWNLNTGSITVAVTEPALGSRDFPIIPAIQDGAKRTLYVLYQMYEVISHNVI